MDTSKMTTDELRAYWEGVIRKAAERYYATSEAIDSPDNDITEEAADALFEAEDAAKMAIERMMGKYSAVTLMGSYVGYIARLRGAQGRVHLFWNEADVLDGRVWLIVDDTIEEHREEDEKSLYNELITFGMRTHCNERMDNVPVSCLSPPLKTALSIL